MTLRVYKWTSSEHNPRFSLIKSFICPRIKLLKLRTDQKVNKLNKYIFSLHSESGPSEHDHEVNHPLPINYPIEASVARKIDYL